MPKRRKDEPKADYMKRCVPILMAEGKSNEQAVAICYSMAEEK